MEIPNNLCLTDGKITMHDGSDASDYLKKWMKRNRVGEGTAINLICRSDLVNLEDKAWEAQNLMQAA